MTQKTESVTAELGPNRDIIWNGKGYVCRDTLITTNDHGVENHWVLSRQVTPKIFEDTAYANEQERAERAEAVQNDGQRVEIHESRACEWPVNSGWSEGHCGRNGGRSPYGLTLCWQHEDVAFSHVLDRIRDSHYGPLQVEKLTHALLNSERRLGGYDGEYGRIRTSPLIYAEVKKYIEELIDGAWMEPGISDLLDKLITSRLQEKWGAA